MRLDDSLVTRRSETRDGDAVLRCDLGSAVPPLRVAGARRPRARHEKELLLGKRRRHHLLVGDDLGAGRVIDGLQLHEVEVRRFPELLGEVQREPALGRREHASGHDQPLARVGRGLVDTVVKKTRGGASEHVADEVPALSVEGVEERARALELLDLAQQRSGLRIQRVLGNAVGPDDPQDVHLPPRPETQVRDRTGRRSVDVEVLRLGLDLGAVAEAVDLGRPGRQPLERDVDPAVGVAAPVLVEDGAPGGSDEDQVEVAVPVEVHGLGVARQRQRTRVRAREVPRAVVSPERRGVARIGEEEVERAVVVVVEEQRRLSRPDLLRRPERSVTPVERAKRPASLRPDEIDTSVAVEIAERRGVRAAGLGKPRLAQRQAALRAGCRRARSPGPPSATEGPRRRPGPRRP